ncbi:hypothetical protein H4R99_004735 [Coemansia sp. RSA 1722]|nr:hypothetical protein LPJ57_001779 [Coemansia sp. RSA 486]KAJ2238205.1 hypothetical protein IWW45_000214 [Coemansia sp. RSA 485]KAJ2594588.1 hypothetical protein GGF39_004156 [Coemansia sp. RSA 1721]KAJ2596881.1 hypothetical protein H4R99_004735 [Coemansia sp. RSA 1722]KAJ2634638.1 hypothetical protein GGF40_004079 [Coemansia sp. RSA 1286]
MSMFRLATLGICAIGAVIMHALVTGNRNQNMYDFYPKETKEQKQFAERAAKLSEKQTKKHARKQKQVEFKIKPAHQYRLSSSKTGCPWATVNAIRCHQHRMPQYSYKSIKASFDKMAKALEQNLQE